MLRAASIATAVLAVSVYAAPAAAAELAISNFTGPGAAGVRTQVVKAVCAELDCLPPAKNVKKGNVLGGKVLGKGKKLSLELSLTTNGKQKWKKTYPLTGGKLSADNVQKASKQILGSFQAKAPPPPPPPPEPTPPPPPPEPTPPPPPPEPEKKPEDSTAAREEEKKSEDADTSTSASISGAWSPAILYLSANVDLMSRSFALENLSSANLHEYKGFPIAAPHLHLDLYPLARSRGFIAGLGFEADFAMTVGLKAVAGANDYPSSLMRFAGALKFRIPFTSGGIAVVPAVGFGYTSFSLSPAKDGSALAGLPQVTYLGLRAGVGLDAPLLDDKLRLALNVSYIPVFGAGEVISPTYFPAGSVWGLGVTFGAGYRVVSPLEIRLGFSLDRYGLSFNTEPTDTYRATGASDLLWALSLGLGFVY